MHNNERNMAAVASVTYFFVWPAPFQITFFIPVTISVTSFWRKFKVEHVVFSHLSLPLGPCLITTGTIDSCSKRRKDKMSKVWKIFIFLSNQKLYIKTSSVKTLMGC